MLSSAVQERKFKLLVFNFLYAEQISFPAELCMIKSFITSGPGILFLNNLTYQKQCIKHLYTCNKNAVSSCSVLFAI